MKVVDALKYLECQKYINIEDLDQEDIDQEVSDKKTYDT